jgi:hypothetical protein
MIKPKLKDDVTEHISLSAHTYSDLLEFNIKDQNSVSKTIIYPNISMQHDTKQDNIHDQVFLIE